ncbi:MAG: hypothetical protein AAF849_22635 [Bacteroidota bacterium]
MDIALSALVILLLLSPGAAFRISYIESDSLQYTVDTSITGELLFIVVVSFIFNAIGISIANVVAPSDLKIVVASISNMLSDNTEALAFESISSDEIHLDWSPVVLFTTFTFFLLIFASISGKGFRKVVIKYNWDYRFQFLRISNQWWYFLTGREFGLKQETDFDYIQIDALVSCSEGDYIYSGELSKFFFNRRKELNRIYLKGVFRRELNLQRTGLDIAQSDDNDDSANITSDGESKDVVLINQQSLEKNFDESFEKLSSSYFVIEFKEIRNINVSYVKIV